jgi:hypothetical protein
MGPLLFPRLDSHALSQASWFFSNRECKEKEKKDFNKERMFALWASITLLQWQDPDRHLVANP